MKWIILHSMVLGSLLMFMFKSIVTVINGEETVTWFLITYPSLLDVGINLVLITFMVWRVSYDVKKYKVKHHL